MSDQAIQMKGLCCQSGHRYLLQDINWTVKTGENWAIIGENGSGKTTLLSVAAGFKQHTKGTVRVFDQPFEEDHVLALRQRIGFVSNSFFDKYYTKESVARIIMSGKCGTFGIDETMSLADMRLVKKLLAALNLSDKVDYPFSFLSKGERQSILIARALMAGPALYLLDEPMTGLDAINKKNMMGLAQRIARETGSTMCYVTHHLDEISPNVFTHCLLLRKGRIFASGKTIDLLNSDRLSAFFRHAVTVGLTEDGYYEMKVGD